ncbi:hypothetical protein ACPCZR_12680 [Bacillus bombysepticus]
MNKIWGFIQGGKNMKDYYLVRKGKLWVSDASTTHDDMQAPFDVITVSVKRD